MENNRPLAMTVLSGLLAFTGLATLAFWILFFSGKMDATETEQDEAFEKAFASEFDTVFARMGTSPAVGDEVRQTLRQKLFVASGEGKPKIATYAGRGDLRSWLRASAVRELISHARKQRKEIPVADPVLAAFADGDDAPELQFDYRVLQGLSLVPAGPIEGSTTCSYLPAVEVTGEVLGEIAAMLEGLEPLLAHYRAR